MLFSKSLLAAALVFSVVSATPTPDWKEYVGWDGVTLAPTDIGTPVSDLGLEKRATDGIYICVNINWGPPCGYAQQQLGACISLGTDWAGQISSFGPDPGQKCTAYSSFDCSIGKDGGFWGFVNPGNATGGLGTPNPWNDRINSWLCE